MKPVFALAVRSALFLLCTATLVEAVPLEQLGRGYHYFESGDYAAAVQELRPLATVRLHNRDLVLYLLAQSEAMTGVTTAALSHFRAVAGMKQSRFGAGARARAGDCAFALGRLTEARRDYSQALKIPAPMVEPAVLHFRLGEIADRRHEPKEAMHHFRELFLHSPAHPLAEGVRSRIGLISAADHLERAKRLLDDRLWDRAIEELLLIPTDVPSEIRTETDYWLGTAQFRTRHNYPSAAEKLHAAADRLTDARRTEALFHGAQAWSRSELPDGDERAIAGYRDLVQRFPHARQAAEASFKIGWLEFNRGHYQAALAPLAETIRRYSTTAEDARWFLGFARWLTGDFPGAIADFVRVRGDKGHYWQARALARIGQLAEALTLWRAIVSDRPFSYYALMARVQLAAAGSPTGPFGPGTFPSDGPASFGARDPKVDRTAAVARADELLRAGLPRFAAFELEAAEKQLLHLPGAPAFFADRYAQSEDFHSLHRIAERFGSGALKADPARNSDVRAMWEQVYPLAYRRFVEKYAPTGKNPPYYLYTIMQKESAYNPHDVSYADAIGLLQMIPPTSRRVAEQIGRPYTEDVLYDPEGNIQFGAWYIGHLLQKFHGQIALGAGSYNAGPQAMMRWLGQHGDRPLDEFIELCPYVQTREYMKKVIDIYAHYVYLYGHEDYLPSLMIDRTVADDGITY